MLDTLNRYVQGSPASSRSGLQDWRPGSDLNRWWPAVVTLSIVGHLIFYAAIVALDWWVYHRVLTRRPIQEPELKVVLLAPPEGERGALRAPPEHLELIDPRRMKFEAGSDDTKLLPRSPSPGASVQSGPGQTNRGQGAGADSRTSGKLPEPSVARARPETQPPGSRSIEEPDRSATEKTAPVTLPVAPTGQPPVPVSPGDTRPRSARESGKSGDDPGRSGRIGLRAAQSQYVAYVRQKIYAENRKIMPSGWIETILSKEVVAEFSLVLDRSGRVKSVRLVQSCGYSTLDMKAREAISLASPFEGFPPELGDSFEMTVDVHYTPYR